MYQGDLDDTLYHYACARNFLSSMRLSSLRLHHFRNYGDLTMNLSHDLTVIYGRNAQGKTNLLEGLYYAAMGFSFRSRHDEELVKFGETDCAAEVTYCDRYGENRLLVKRIQEGKRTRKQAQRNGTPISPKEHYGSLNLVLFTPDDLQLVKGDPSLRRRFLDMEIAQTSRFYYEALQNYNRVLQQRNRFLRHCRDQEKLDEGQLFVWDEALSRSAAVIVFERLKAMEEIERAAGLVYGTITQDREKMTLSYLQKRSDGEGVPPKGLSLSEWQAFYQEELKKRHRLDYVRGYTSMGPHRDDLEILQEGRPLRSFGSQGQQRTAALALKLSELEFIFHSKEEYPILLLDDVLSELDEGRRRMLLDGMGGKVQTLLTVNDRALARSSGDVVFYEVRSGWVEEDAHEGH